VAVGGVPHVLMVRASPIFRVALCRLVNFCVYCFQKDGEMGEGGRGGLVPCPASRDSGPGRLCRRLLRAPKCIRDVISDCCF
jgi:hypothetical protein